MYNINVIGVSAITATLEGINLFSTKLNFIERNEFILNEFVFKNDKNIIILNKFDYEEMLLKGYKFSHRNRFLVTYKGENSLIWYYINNNNNNYLNSNI
jgi:hypothetical protein